jgi:hypothetical protein
MIDIATPVSFGGFTRAALDAFAPQLRALGLEPRQGVAAGGKIEPAMGNPADLKPGSMISVQLMSGDLSVGADGTVTHIDGNRIYAFGHRFLDIGSTALPFAGAEVLTLLANTILRSSSPPRRSGGAPFIRIAIRRWRASSVSGRPWFRFRSGSATPARPSTPTR